MSDGMTKTTTHAIETAATALHATGDTAAFYDLLLELKAAGKRWTYREVSDITGLTEGVLRLELAERAKVR